VLYFISCVMWSLSFVSFEYVYNFVACDVIFFVEFEFCVFMFEFMLSLGVF